MLPQTVTTVWRTKLGTTLLIGFNNSTGLSAYFRYLGFSQSPPKRRITPSSSPVWPRGTRALASRELGGTNRDGIVESVQIVSLLVERPT